MKKALIVSCNDNYDYDTRTKYVCRLLTRKGYQVQFLVADFDHRKKAPYRVDREDAIVYIPVRPYRRNLSASRILSHLQFAKGVRNYIQRHGADLVYHCAPPNATIRALSKAKKKQGFYLITEIGDMWPETLPVGSSLKKLLAFPLKIWSNLRDKNLKNSDLVIAQCDLFHSLLIEKSHARKIQTLYFCKPSRIAPDIKPESIRECICLCYLGSINNIADIKTICDLLAALCAKRKTVLHIIGDGERRQELIDAAEKSGAQVHYHGLIFDEMQKGAILQQCHFALNIMKPEVCVGMTMKSLDYFSFGIPMINSIGADMAAIVEKEAIGYNVHSGNTSATAEKILNLTEDDCAALCMHVRASHERHFSPEHFDRVFTEILQQAERNHEDKNSGLQ